MKILGTVYPKAIRPHKCNYCGFEISKGESYIRTTIVADFIYTWKSHIKCQNIAGKLDMFDKCDDGVTSDDFYEFITDKYRDLNEKLMDNPDFKIPDFRTQLEYVYDHVISQNARKLN